MRAGLPQQGWEAGADRQGSQPSDQRGPPLAPGIRCGHVQQQQDCPAVLAEPRGAARGGDQTTSPGAGGRGQPRCGLDRMRQPCRGRGSGGLTRRARSGGLERGACASGFTWRARCPWHSAPLSGGPVCPAATSSRCVRVGETRGRPGQELSFSTELPLLTTNVCFCSFILPFCWFWNSFCYSYNIAFPSAA